jgi:hypothetical protein
MQIIAFAYIKYLIHIYQQSSLNDMFKTNSRFHLNTSHDRNFFLLLFLIWYFVHISLYEATLGEVDNNSAYAISSHETQKSIFDNSSSGDTSNVKGYINNYINAWTLTESLHISKLPP